jgi:hypothetical protein
MWQNKIKSSGIEREREILLGGMKITLGTLAW